MIFHLSSDLKNSDLKSCVSEVELLAPFREEKEKSEVPTMEEGNGL